MSPNCSKAKNTHPTQVCAQILTATHKNNFLSKLHIGLVYQMLLLTWIYVLNSDKEMPKWKHWMVLLMATQPAHLHTGDNNITFKIYSSVKSELL